MSEPRGTENAPAPAAADEAPGAEEIEAHIEQTRHDLAETVDALSAKLDVPTRARHQAQATKHRAAEQIGLARERIVAAASRGNDTLKDVVTDDQGDRRAGVSIAAGVAFMVVAAGAVVVVLRQRRR